jgi:hypothetical protein
METKQLANALRVIVEDPNIRDFLSMQDPKALEQARLALGMDPEPPRFFESSGSWYCAPCANDGHDFGKPMDNNDLQGVYCCNCGRDDFGNKDAHRPGVAVGGPPDFEYSDI